MCFKMLDVIHFDILQKPFVVSNTLIDDSGKFVSVMFLRIIQFAETLWGKSGKLNLVGDSSGT
jgi:hypothetical protein